MSEHLGATMLNALADGELSAEELARVNEHLAACPQCTTSALEASLLKGATARAGQRYAPPADLRERMVRRMAQEAAIAQSWSRQNGAAQEEPENAAAQVEPRRWGFGSWGLAAAALLLVYASIFLLPHRGGRDLVAAADYSALVTEVSDQHIAMLAANAPPEVISTDRHTVKPWFQGRIPFSFNLPQNLPEDTTLDGANLTYLRNQPTAQLLYSIGKHRVSVFVREQAAGTADDAMSPADYQGFHVMGFRAGGLEAVAVSDVEEARLADLVARIKTAQAK